MRRERCRKDVLLEFGQFFLEIVDACVGVSDSCGVAVNRGVGVLREDAEVLEFVAQGAGREFVEVLVEGGFEGVVEPGGVVLNRFGDEFLDVLEGECVEADGEGAVVEVAEDVEHGGLISGLASEAGLQGAGFLLVFDDAADAHGGGEGKDAREGDGVDDARRGGGDGRWPTQRGVVDALAQCVADDPGGEGAGDAGGVLGLDDLGQRRNGRGSRYGNIMRDRGVAGSGWGVGDS